MTMFAEPDTIACPHCEHKYRRSVLLSFNSMRQITFSDGSTQSGIDNIIVYETRCIACQNIIRDVGGLPALQAEPAKPFWHRWFVKQENILFIPRASFDVYVELFEQADTGEGKLKWSVKAYRSYNQNYLLYGKERIASVEMQQRYREITDYILAHPPMPLYEEFHLLCADIYRLRSDFLRSKKVYEMVVGEKFDHIVLQGKQWCTANNASLMAIKDRSQLNVVETAL